MLEIVYEHQFKKDLRLAKKQGKNLGKFRYVLELLLNSQPLAAKNRNHKLKGKYQGYWECHIVPDWLLVYKKTTSTLTLARIGSHSDLF